MEKLLYPLWRPAAQQVDAFRDALLAGLCPQLAARDDIHGLRLCVADSAVEPAAGRRMENNPPLPDAVLSLWVDSAGDCARWEPAIDAAVSRRTCYLVAEAEPLVNQQAHPSAPGERVYGMCHVVFMDPPAGLEREQWLALWKDSHTRVAIDTQSTFGYRQNLVVRALGEDTRPCHAIVEENFPPEAMQDDHAFYASGGDDEVLREHATAMFQSCERFIDLARIDVIPMSEYLFKAL
ncbi:MAG: hypothetical protein CME59_12035 [Halioglobus sp.]|nr:hypothetical protein [Halioglobus sp.]